MTSSKTEPAAILQTSGPLRLGRLALLAALLLIVSVSTTDAAPLFCWDISGPPGLFLTGCDAGAGAPRAETVWPPAEGGEDSDDLVVETLLSGPPQDQLLVQVGPAALEDAQGPGNETADTSADAVQPAKAAPGVNDALEDSPAALLTQDDHWLYMNLDRDGTYLFLGGLDEMDDKLRPDDAPETTFPDGIGIGKRWRF
jgi:hypothetical protein